MTALRVLVGLSCGLAIGTLSACAVKQPPAGADALKSVLPATTVVPPEWSATGGSAAPVVVDWVPLFGDKQLEALVGEGLLNNLDLKAAAGRVGVAMALVTQARALLYPQINLVGDAGLVGRDYVKDRSGIGGDVSWELDLWGRVRSQGASAAANQQAREADMLYARQSLAATVTRLWYHAIMTERLRQTAQDATALYSDLLRLVQIRNNIGNVGQQEVALAGADLDRARQKERAFATSEQQIVRGLEVVVGRYPKAELLLAPDLPPLPAPVPAGLPADLLARRPDLIAAERTVASAFHLIQSAEALRLPRIALTGSGGVSTSELLRLANVPAGYWTFAANLFWPLFNGGAIDAQVQQATSEQQAALALFGQAALNAFSEVETSLANEQLLADQQKYIESVLAQDTEALRLGRIRYNAGATDLFDVLQLQAKQLNTQFDLIGIRNDRLANRVGLHLALGGGFEQAPTP